MVLVSRWWLVTVWCCGGLMLAGAGLSAWAAPGWTPGRVQAITASVWVTGFVVQTTRLYCLRRRR